MAFLFSCLYRHQTGRAIRSKSFYSYLTKRISTAIPNAGIWKKQQPKHIKRERFGVKRCVIPSK